MKKGGTVIEAAIRIISEDRDLTDSLCEMPVLPPIGGYITVIDRNANHRVLRVQDVVVGAVSKKMLEELPNVSRWGLRTTILCEETFGHPMGLPSE